MWRETSYYVMTTKRAGQVRGEMNPWPPRSRWSVLVTTGLLMNSQARGQCIWWPLVSLAGQQTDVSLTQSALISWPVEAGKPQWCGDLGGLLNVNQNRIKNWLMKQENQSIFFYYHVCLQHFFGAPYLVFISYICTLDTLFITVMYLYADIYKQKHS